MPAICPGILFCFSYTLLFIVRFGFSQSLCHMVPAAVKKVNNTLYEIYLPRRVVIVINLM